MQTNHKDIKNLINTATLSADIEAKKNAIISLGKARAAEALTPLIETLSNPNKEE